MAAPRTVYLVRHASPRIDPNAPGAAWPLSPRGVEEAQALARVAAGWGLAAIYSSAEQKAASTALIVAESLGLPVRVVDGFEELRFDEWIGNADEFSEAVRAILEHPDASVRGAERASAAAERFGAGMGIVQQGALPAAVVSHGRVLTAYLAALLVFEDPFELWQSIPMPGWAPLDLGPRPMLAAPFEGIDG